MNLYRSFGNLMETWVTEETPCHEPPWLGNNAKESSSDMGTNLRSESVDSGVETASCDTFLSAAGSVSTDSPETDLFTPQRGLSPSSTSQSPLLSSPALSSSSSSSPQFCPSRLNEGSANAHLMGGQTLQMTESLHLQDKPKPLTVEEVLNRRPRAPVMPKRHSSDLVRSHRTQSLEQRWRVSPSVPVRQMSDLCRRPVSINFDKESSEGVAVADRKELSPGLDYLEQVCQMLEGMARQQMHSRGIQPEMEALWEDQDAQAPDTCQSDSTDDEEDLSSRQRLEKTGNAEDASSEPQRRKYGHFRQRSASDTALSTLHLRKLNTRDRTQLMSTNDLLEKAEDYQEEQNSTKTDTNKTRKGWRLKFGSLGKFESAVFNTKSQQTQSSEKKSARRRLSQLFKRRKTLPM